MHDAHINEELKREIQILDSLIQSENENELSRAELDEKFESNDPIKVPR